MKLSARILVPIGVIGLAVSLAACGSRSEADSATSNTVPAVTSSQIPAPQASSAPNGAPNPQSTADRTAFRTCLQQHGITLPSRAPGSFGQGGGQGGQGFAGGPGGPAGAQGGQGFAGGQGNSQAFQDAIKACGGANFGGFRPGGAGPNSAAFQAYRSCLSDHGVTLPTAGGARSNLATPDPKTAAALKKCAPLRPSFQRQPAPAAS